MPGPIPALDFVIGIMLEDTKEQIKSMTDEIITTTVETAKSLGIKGIEELVGSKTGTVGVGANDLSLSTGNVKDIGYKKYETIDISQSTLEKLLSGKIRNLKQIQNFNEMDRKNDEQVYREAGNQPYKSSTKYKILYRNDYDEKISDDIQIIETIFIKQ